MSQPTTEAGHLTIEEETVALAFRTLVERARANHLRWQHEAELLEECSRALCLGAKMLLWPDAEAIGWEDGLRFVTNDAGIRVLR